jgi:hypothetical protein
MKHRCLSCAWKWSSTIINEKKGCSIERSILVKRQPDNPKPAITI